MLVSSGNAQGHRLHLPTVKDLKPIPAFIRKPLFDSFADKIIGSSVLDLFAGCGSLGIEALSRGAKIAHFVDSSPLAGQSISKNLNHSHFLGKGQLFCTDAFEFLLNHFEIYTIVFIDPPSNYNNLNEIFYRLQKNLDNAGLVILRHSQKPDLSLLKNYRFIKDAWFGNERFAIFNFFK